MATWLLHFLNIFYLHSKACSFVYIWTKNCKSFIFFIDAAATPYYNEWQRRRKKQHLLSSWDRLTSPMTLNSLRGRKWIGGIPSRISDEILKSLHSKLTSPFPLSFLSLLFLSFSLHHSLISLSLPLSFQGSMASPGAMIAWGRVINDCRVRKEISTGQAFGQREGSGLCRLQQGPVEVLLADVTEAWPFSWGSRDNGVSANQLT